LADDWRTAQESVQATAQSWFCHAARVSKGRRDVNVKRGLVMSEFEISSKDDNGRAALCGRTSSSSSLPIKL
jgi:hypothetical protein